MAMGLDYDDNPKEHDPYRQLAPSADAGAVLSTGILDGLSEEQMRNYLVPVVKGLFSLKFWVENGGIRTTSANVPNRLGYIQYHGSQTIWLQEQEDILLGLQRYGLGKLAWLIRDTRTNAINRAQGFPEFLHVTTAGCVDYDPFKKLLPRSTNRTYYEVASDPVNGGQTWVITAELHTKHERTRYFRHPDPEPAGWRKELCDEILSTFPPTRVLSINEIKDTRPPYTVLIDTEEGRRRFEEHKRLANLR